MGYTDMPHELTRHFSGQRIKEEGQAGVAQGSTNGDSQQQQWEAASNASEGLDDDDVGFDRTGPRNLVSSLGHVQVWHTGCHACLAQCHVLS